jgi:hypothetical protein
VVREGEKRNGRILHFPGQDVNGAATGKYRDGGAGAVQKDSLFQFGQDLLLILQNGRLVFLDGALIGLQNGLVRKDRFLILQNLLLVSDHVVLRHFSFPHFQNDSSGTWTSSSATARPAYSRPPLWNGQYDISPNRKPENCGDLGVPIGCPSLI